MTKSTFSSSIVILIVCFSLSVRACYANSHCSEYEPYDCSSGGEDFGVSKGLEKLLISLVVVGGVTYWVYSASKKQKDEDKKKAVKEKELQFSFDDSSIQIWLLPQTPFYKPTQLHHEYRYQQNSQLDIQLIQFSYSW